MGAGSAWTILFQKTEALLVSIKLLGRANMWEAGFHGHLQKFFHLCCYVHIWEERPWLLAGTKSPKTRLISSAQTCRRSHKMIMSFASFWGSFRNGPTFSPHLVIPSSQCFWKKHCFWVNVCELRWCRLCLAAGDGWCCWLQCKMQRCSSWKQIAKVPGFEAQSFFTACTASAKVARPLRTFKSAHRHVVTSLPLFCHSQGWNYSLANDSDATNDICYTAWNVWSCATTQPTHQ